MLSSYDRVMAALSHRKPDRPPLNIYGAPELLQQLREHLGLETHSEMLRWFGADFRYVEPQYIGPAQWCGLSGFHCGGVDVWGVRWERSDNAFCTYYEPVPSSLARAQTLREIDEYPWPDPDWFSFKHLREQIKSLNGDERYAITYAGNPFIETVWYMRGLEQFLIDMIESPEMFYRMLEKSTRFYTELIKRAIDAAGDMIDIIWSSSDVGGQHGMIISPQAWREHIKPWQREFITPFKQMGFKTHYHSDGSLEPIIEDFIEMGLDLLDPIQPNTPGMEPEELTERYGGRLAFYGGIDTQHLMPHGTPEQIEQELLRYIRTLGEEASYGYVVAASNALQPDVPIENIMALFRTAREYRY